MKKSVIIFVSLVFILSVGTFAQTIDTSIGDDIETYVKGFLENGGISQDKVSSIKKMNQKELPDEVEIKKIEENSVGIYEVNYTNDISSKKIFVVTYSTPELEIEKPIVNIQNLNFGFAGKSEKSEYLNSAMGVSTENRGYVMMRSGSITGISTNLGLDGNGKVEIKVYKNGEDSGFSNLISTDDNSKKDFDLQSEDIVSFNAGDVISVYVETYGNVEWSDAITLVEITN